MALKDPNKISLSKSILEMKFMKKTKEKVEKETYQQEGEEYFNKQGLRKLPGQYLTNSSYKFCEELLEGRFSFQGENPELERELELEELERQSKNQKENENENDADISDTQLAKMWKSTTKINVNNISNTESEIEPQRKKPKFLKPKDY